MSIWKTHVTPEEINQFCKQTIHQALGIEFTEVGENYLKATLPVDSRTHQPAGILHGGASVVLAESLGSIASLLVAGLQDSICVGIEVSASHLNSIRTGRAEGTVTPIRLGNSVHVWEIKIKDQNNPKDELICHSKLTVLIKKKKLS
jgi:1,4-dihydroxy-2-naphthoyl-CoA hydrolase